MEYRFELLEKEYKDTCIMQLRGNFFNAYNMSAVVLSGIRGYKLKDSAKGYKCGFPHSALDSVCADFNKNHVDYRVYSGEDLVASETFTDNGFAQYVKMYCPPLKDGREKDNTYKEKGAHEAPADLTEKGSGTKGRMQKISVINGSGISFEDAVYDIKKNMENTIIGNGFRIISFSFVVKDNGISPSCGLQGIVVYE